MTGNVDGGALDGLPGLEAAGRQLREVITVLLTDQKRRQASSAVSRSPWKNLVFTGLPGTGKSRAGTAVGCAYEELGLLSTGHLDEVSALDLVGATRAETSALVGSAAKHSTGGVLMINDAHNWHHLPDRGQHVQWELYKKLTEYRKEMRDDLAVILAGQAEPIHQLRHSAPPLAARFSAVIDFPGYTPSQLTAILVVLAAEAGLTLSREAEDKAARLIAQANCPPGSARLAVRLLNQATAAQARRLAASSGIQDPSTLGTLTEADIPGLLNRDALTPGDARTGQYL